MFTLRVILLIIAIVLAIMAATPLPRGRIELVSAAAVALAIVGLLENVNV